MSATNAPESAVPSPTPATAPSSSVWEDFIDIFYAPRQVFERRRDGRFGLALVVLAVLTGILFWVAYQNLTPIWDAQWERQAADIMAQRPQITRAQLERGHAMAGIVAPIGAVLMAVVGPLILGIVLWVIARLFEAQLSLRQGITIAVYSQFPRLLTWVVAIILGLVLAPERLTSMYSVMLSPAMFLPFESTPKLLLAFVGRLEVFIIWATVLIAIGVSVIGRIPKARAFAVAAIVWLLGTAPAIWGANKM